MSHGPRLLVRQYVIVPDKVGLNGVGLDAERTGNPLGCSGMTTLTLAVNLTWVAASEVDISYDTRFLQPGTSNTFSAWTPIHGATTAATGDTSTDTVTRKLLDLVDNRTVTSVLQHHHNAPTGSKVAPSSKRPRHMGCYPWQWQ